MQSQVTLGDLRSYYSSIINPADANDAEFLRAVNKALQRIIESGQWVGTNVEVVFAGSTGYITLPPHFSSVIGVTINKVPIPVYSEFHQYCEFGPGTFDASLPARSYLSQVSEGVTTVIDLTAGQQIRIRPAVAADAGKILRFFGTDTNDQPIYDVASGKEGIAVGILNPVAVMATPLNTFTGLQKALTLGRVSLYGWNGVTETLLSQYQPYETRPSYTRYAVGTVDSSLNIGCLCRLRHLPVYYDTDFIRVGNLAAWENALQGVKLDSIGQFDKSDLRWEECFKMLNREHMSRRGKARPELTFSGPLSNATRVTVN